jgi:hypothetical protein
MKIFHLSRPLRFEMPDCLHQLRNFFLDKRFFIVKVKRTAEGSMSDEEPENPMEKLTEELHEEATHGHEAWLKWSALLSALFAVLAAISGLKSTQFASMAMVEQLQASDQWGYYQAKGTRATIIETEQDLLRQFGKPTQPSPQDEKYRQEQAQIKADANAKTEASESHMDRHEILSRSVTLFQVSIAVIAVSVLTRRRHFLLLSVAMAALGGFFLVQGLF